MKGIGAVTEPFIKIPSDDYYYWQRFFQIPFFFLTSIVFAGVIRLLSETVGGKGSFVDIFCIISITQTFPMFITMWIPETIVFLFFPCYEFNPIFDIARQVIGIIWPLVLAIIGITKSEKIKWYLSILFTLIAAIPMTALMVIFIR
jgi:hypothetical protein